MKRRRLVDSRQKPIYNVALDLAPPPTPVKYPKRDRRASRADIVRYIERQQNCNTSETIALTAKLFTGGGKRICAGPVAGED